MKSFEYYMGEFLEGYSNTLDVDYDRMESVRKNNRGVNIYRKAAQSIGKYYPDRVVEFARLLDSDNAKERQVCAICLIEFMNPDAKTREHALQIIRDGALYGDYLSRYGWYNWLEKHAPQEAIDWAIVYCLQANDFNYDSRGMHFKSKIIGFFNSSEHCHEAEKYYMTLPDYYSSQRCIISTSPYYIYLKDHEPLKQIYLVRELGVRPSGTIYYNEVGVFATMAEAVIAKSKYLENRIEYNHSQHDNDCRIAIDRYDVCNTFTAFM